jgi:crotonobetainyl-CoA:carnitine CoA-transferase CaiB-like acyl-CoA transferase
VLTTLEGVNVLDFGIYFAGPYGPRLLADLGADVIKLESLDGDLLRPTTKPFNAAARGKRSIAVDLKNPHGRAVAHDLVRWADVVTHNMRPGVAERLGMDYQTVRPLKPDMIYAYAPGWGSSGPDAPLPGFAPLFGGYCGLHHEAGGRGGEPIPPVGNEDNGNGLVGAAAILLALFHRRRTGQGQYLENPQLSATLLMGMHLMRRSDGSLVGSRAPDRQRLRLSAVDGFYPTSDGWLCISARLDREFEALAQIPGLEQLQDPRYRTLAGRQSADAELVRILAPALQSDTSSAWADRLHDAGVPCEVEAGAGAAERFLRDPEQARLGRVETYEHPRWGTIRDVAVMVRLSTADSQPGRPPPELGQHTREVLSELGYASDRITRLFDEGVVR